MLDCFAYKKKAYISAISGMVDQRHRRAVGCLTRLTWTHRVSESLMIYPTIYI